MNLSAARALLPGSNKFQWPNHASGPVRASALFGPGGWCFLGAWRLALVLSATLGARAIAAPAAGWQLLPTAQVDSAGIFLHHIVGAQIPALPPSIRLSAAPALGQAASFSRAQINEMLQRVAPELVTTNWSGALQVRVTRRLRSLGETELRDLLTATLQNQFVKDKGDLELRFRSPWAALSVPDEAFTMKVLDFPATGVNANFIVRFELLTTQEKVGEWQVVAQGKLMREVLVARTPLKRGQLLNEADVTPERRDIVPLREPLSVSVVQDDHALELTENVPEGLPLLARSVRQHPIVQRGRVVDAVINDGALSISMKVEALADGVAGQTIRVRNPRTRKEFLGKVQNEQTILVTL